MRRLFHYPLDPHSRKIRLALAEKKLEAELLLERPWEKRKEFLIYNPAGETPVLIEDDHLVVTGDPGIAEYLEEAYPDIRLLGKTQIERIETRRLSGWFDQKFFREVSGPLLEEKLWKRFSRQGGPDSGAIRMAKANLPYHMDYISWLVENRNWLAGELFSLADIAAAAALSCLDYLGDIDWGKWESAKHWYARVKSRPSFRPLLSDSLPGLPPPMHYTDLDF